MSVASSQSIADFFGKDSSQKDTTSPTTNNETVLGSDELKQVMFIDKWMKCGGEDAGNWRITGMTGDGKQCCVWLRTDKDRPENAWLEPLISVTQIGLAVRLTTWNSQFNCWSALVLPPLNQNKIVRDTIEQFGSPEQLLKGNTVSSVVEKDTPKPKEKKVAKKKPAATKFPEGRVFFASQVQSDRVEAIAELVRQATGINKSTFQGECLWEGILTVAKRYGVEI